MMKKVPTIHNVEEAGDFFWGQIEPISEFNKQLLSDCKAVMSINTEFTNGVKTAFSSKKDSSVESIVPKEKSEPAKLARTKKPAAKTEAPASATTTEKLATTK